MFKKVFYLNNTFKTFFVWFFVKQYLFYEEPQENIFGHPVFAVILERQVNISQL